MVQKGSVGALMKPAVQWSRLVLEVPVTRWGGGSGLLEAGWGGWNGGSEGGSPQTGYKPSNCLSWVYPLTSPPPWREAGLGLSPRQDPVLIRHTTMVRYRSQEKAEPRANAQRVKLEGKETGTKELIEGRHNAKGTLKERMGFSLWEQRKQRVGEGEEGWWSLKWWAQQEGLWKGSDGKDLRALRCLRACG